MTMFTAYTAGIIPIFKGDDTYRYLIVQGKENLFWNFPKGQHALGEKAEECAQRELFEETGIKDIDVQFDEPYKIIFPFLKNGITCLKEMTFFYGYVKNMAIHIQESEICCHKRATLDECLGLLSFDDLKKMIIYISNHLERHKDDHSG